MEAAAALVRSDSGVKLYAVASVYLYLAAVIYPSDAELDGAFRLNDAIENACFNKVGALVGNGGERFENLAYCLKEFLFARITLCNALVKVSKICIFDFHSNSSFQIVVKNNLTEKLYHPCDRYAIIFLSCS